jgi:hypothetical protein
VTDPARIPKDGGNPRNLARPTPTTFWATAKRVAITNIIITCGPPTRSNDTLAPSPMQVKKEIINGVCSVVSN